MKIHQKETNAASMLHQTLEKTPARARDSRGIDPVAGSKTAEVEISENARLMKQAHELARNAPDIRENRVASLRQKIRDGSYSVDSGALAERIIAEHLATDFGKNNL
jgi:negative regulator of flagellin synthesis FlgM